MDELDKNSSILEWGSEEIVVRYLDPVSGKIRRYFPDFTIKKRTNQKKIVKQMIEIKPLHQCFPPKRGKKTRSYLNQCATYATNMAKWKAAKAYCEAHDMEFIIVTRNNNDQLMMLTEKEVGF